MFTWYITENFSLKVLKIAVLVYGSFLLQCIDYCIVDFHFVISVAKGFIAF